MNCIQAPVASPPAAVATAADDPSEVAPYSFTIGAAVEVALWQPGLIGSWYPATIMHLSEQEPTALVCMHGLASSPDKEDDGHAGGTDIKAQRGGSALVEGVRRGKRVGALHKTLPLSSLRPVPPEPPEHFTSQLAPGKVAELWLRSGWWQVLVKQAPSAGAVANWTLESVQYGHSMRMHQPTLRPCWRWDATLASAAAADAADALAWVLVERLALPPPSLVPPLTATLVSLPSHASASERVTATESAIRGGSGNKRRRSEVALQRQEVARERRELLLAKFAVGDLVEVRGVEEGFLGSWYAARILETKEDRTAIKFRVCYVAFVEDDGSLWEDWLDAHDVRPMPPQHQPSFIERLRGGSSLEVLIEEGWWAVELAKRGADGQYVVVAQRYQAEHAVPLERLRPVWHWSAHEQERDGWSTLDRQPPATA